MSESFASRSIAPVVAAVPTASSHKSADADSWPARAGMTVEPPRDSKIAPRFQAPGRRERLARSRLPRVGGVRNEGGRDERDIVLEAIVQPQKPIVLGVMLGMPLSENLRSTHRRTVPESAERIDERAPLEVNDGAIDVRDAPPIGRDLNAVVQSYARVANVLLYMNGPSECLADDVHIVEVVGFNMASEADPTTNKRVGHERRKAESIDGECERRKSCGRQQDSIGVDRHIYLRSGPPYGAPLFEKGLVRLKGVFEVA